MVSGQNPFPSCVVSNWKGKSHSSVETRPLGHLPLGMPGGTCVRQSWKNWTDPCLGWKGLWTDRLGGNKVIDKRWKLTPPGLGRCLWGSAKVGTGMPREVKPLERQQPLPVAGAPVWPPGLGTFTRKGPPSPPVPSPGHFLRAVSKSLWKQDGPADLNFGLLASRRERE